MREDEYDEFIRETRNEQPKTIKASELAEGGDRTLTLGYDIDRTTVHVYLLDGSIVCYCYTREEAVDKRSAPELEAEDLRPTKRSYPQYTDLAFARLMRERTEFGLSLTNWNEPVSDGPFYGKLY